MEPDVQRPVSGRPPLVLLVSDAGGVAGAERVLATVAASPSARFVAAVPAANTGLASCLRQAGAEVLPLPHLDRRLRPGAVRALVATARRLRPAGVLINLTDQGDGQSALGAARLWRTPTAVCLHLWVPGRPPWRAPLYRAALRGPWRVVTPGSGTAADLAAIGVHATVVPNGLRPPALLERSEARRRLGLPDHAVVVGGVGRLTDQKGWDLLAAAWPAIARRNGPGVRGAVIGEGAQRHDLEAAGIEVLGEVADAARLLRAFDVIVMPSRFEAHALVPIEAALAGTPAILADIAGIRESAGPGARLVPPGDPAALGGAVCEVLADLAAWKGDATAAVAAATERHDPGRMIERLLAEALGG